MYTYYLNRPAAPYAVSDEVALIHLMETFERQSRNGSRRFT